MKEKLKGLENLDMLPDEEAEAFKKKTGIDDVEDEELDEETKKKLGLI